MIKYLRLKRFFTLLLILTLLPINSTSIKAAEIGKYVQNAQTLQVLGLFKGTSNGFELNKISTRSEAAVMLVRLLGAEEIAIQESSTSLTLHPFKDVPTWANPYINYLYSRGLTKGTTDRTFGSDNNVTANQYSTMLLRALGYKDSDGLYKWDHALDYAGAIGLINGQELSELKPLANKSLLRDNMARLSYNSLFTDKRNTQISLIASLLDNQVISTDKLKEAIKIDTSLAQFYNHTETPPATTEMRAVWITYMELQKLLKNATAMDFKKAIGANFEKSKLLGLNTVLVQVRPYGDALYSSQYFPWSYYVTGKEGTDPGFDPLQIMVEEAHEQGLKIEAWINPFRIRSAGSPLVLSTSNPATAWLKDGSNRVIQMEDAGIFYNPANQDVRDLITNGVREIVENYAIDGIHFDDYFYPSKSLTFDNLEYNQYQKEGGQLTQSDWRRENVNLLVKAVYREIKSINPNVQFGISPQGSFEANYNQQYIDVAKWLSSSEYVDYICPQIYYGYNNKLYPYAQTVEKWNELITSDTIKLYIGLAAYKIGLEDKNAGTSGKLEWVSSKNMLQRMVLDARQMSNYSGFMLFRYNFVFEPEVAVRSQVNEEIEALKSILTQ